LFRHNSKTFNIEIIEKFRRRALREGKTLTMQSLFKLMYVFSRSRNHHISQMIGPLLYENKNIVGKKEKKAI